MNKCNPSAASSPGAGQALVPDAAIDELVALAGPNADTPLLTVEVRHLGGRRSVERPGHRRPATVIMLGWLALYRWARSSGASGATWPWRA